MRLRHTIDRRQDNVLRSYTCPQLEAKLWPGLAGAFIQGRPLVKHNSWERAQQKPAIPLVVELAVHSQALLGESSPSSPRCLLFLRQETFASEMY